MSSTEISFKVIHTYELTLLQYYMMSCGAMVYKAIPSALYRMSDVHPPFLSKRIVLIESQLIENHMAMENMVHYNIFLEQVALSILLKYLSRTCVFVF